MGREAGVQRADRLGLGVRLAAVYHSPRPQRVVHHHRPPGAKQRQGSLEIQRVSLLVCVDKDEIKAPRPVLSPQQLVERQPRVADHQLYALPHPRALPALLGDRRHLRIQLQAREKPSRRQGTCDASGRVTCEGSNLPPTARRSSAA